MSHFTVDTSIRRGHPRSFRASPSRPDFTPEEVAAATAASGLLTEGVRRAILTSAIAQQETVDAPGPLQPAQACARTRSGRWLGSCTARWSTAIPTGVRRRGARR